MGNALAPADKIARALGITPEVFTAWAARLTATRERNLPPGRSSKPRITASRMFEATEGHNLREGKADA
jgi:hypothetical protein